MKRPGAAWSDSEIADVFRRLRKPRLQRGLIRFARRRAEPARAHGIVLATLRQARRIIGFYEPNPSAPASSFIAWIRTRIIRRCSERRLVWDEPDLFDVARRLESHRLIRRLEALSSSLLRDPSWSPEVVVTALRHVKLELQRRRLCIDRRQTELYQWAKATVGRYVVAFEDVPIAPARRTGADWTRSDREAVAEYLLSKPAFTELHKSALRITLNKQQAEDAVQDAIASINQTRSFDPAKSYGFRSPLIHWTRQIVANAAKRVKKVSNRVLEPPPKRASRRKAHEEVREHPCARCLVFGGIYGLKELHRDILKRYYPHGLDRPGLSDAAVAGDDRAEAGSGRVALHRAFRELERILEIQAYKHCDECELTTWQGGE